MREELEIMPKPAERADSRAADLAVVKAPTRRVGVLVLGMHRSGSSAMTRMLSLLGCTLPLTPMPVAFDNPRGHWESQRIADFNDEILELAGTQWDDWLPVNPRLSETLVWPQLVARGRDILHQEFADAPLFVLKDPRICKLGSFWLEVLVAEGVDPAFVLPLRNPIEVARSLSARNGIDEYLGLLVWLRHVLAAEAASRGRPRVFADFAGLLDHWEELSVRLSAGLGLVWPRISALSGSEISQFLTPELRHHVSNTAELGNNIAISPWVRKAYEVLLGWARHGERPADHATLDRITREFDDAGTAFARPMLNAGRAVKRAKQADAERSALAEERDGAARRLTEAEAQLSQASIDRDAHMAERDEINHDRVALTEERDRLAGQQATLAAERDMLAVRIGEVETELGQAKVSLQAAATERDELAAEHTGLAAEHDRTVRRLAEIGDEFSQVRLERDATIAERERLAVDLAGRQEERDRLVWRLGEIEAELALACGERDTRTAEREALAGGHAALAEERDKVRWRLGEVEAELARACGERDARTTERDQLADERAALAEQYNNIVWRLGEVEAEFTRTKVQSDQDGACISRLEDALAIAHAETNSLKHRLAVTESTLHQREEEIGQLGTELDKTRLAVAEQTATTAAARDSENLAMQESRDLRGLIASDNALHAARTNQIQGELAEARAAVQQAEVRAFHAESQRDASSQQLADRFAELATLAKLLQNSKAQEQAVQAALSQAQARFEKHLSEVSKLTRLYQHETQKTQAQRAQTDWLREVYATLEKTPRWWAIMPRRWRNARRLRRLQRKGIFDGNAYLDRYRDVAIEGMDPLHHYILHGMAEARSL